jgi:alpha-glucosidase
MVECLIIGWLPVHENYLEVNVQRELKDRDSILNFYRQLIKARKNNEALRFGSWRTLIHYPYEHLAYVRETKAERVLILINFSYEKDLTIDEPISPDNWEVLVSNTREAGKLIELPKTLESFEVSVLRK